MFSEEDMFFQSFETFLQSEMQSTKCPGAAVVVVKGSSIAYIKGFGVNDVNTQDSVNVNTVFRLGSLSKGFTGILAAKLIEEGHFNWGDKARDIIPEFTLKDSAHANRITVEHILSHSTGVGRHSYTNLIEDGMSLEDIIPKFSTVGVHGKEGELYSYQNATFAMIEKIIQRKTGKSYADWLRSDVFEPAGMQNASLSYSALKGNQNTALPHRWSRKNRAYYTKSINNKYYNAISAGGVNASISDMGNWLKMLLGNSPDVISPQVIDTVFRPIVKIGGRKSYHRWEGVNNAYYGIGWRILNYDDKEVVYHGGYVNDYVSQIAIDREQGIAICVLYNAVNSSVPRVIPEFLKRYANYNRKESAFIGAIRSKPAILSDL